MPGSARAARRVPPLEVVVDEISSPARRVPPLEVVVDEISSPATFQSRRVDRIFAAIQQLTPRGCMKPWRVRRYLDILRQLVEDRIPEDDIIDYVRGAAELIDAGQENGKWWSIPNLFGDAMPVWQNKIEAMREAKRRREAQDRHYDEQVANARGTRSHGESVTDLELSRSVRELRKHIDADDPNQLHVTDKRLEHACRDAMEAWARRREGESA